MTADDTRNDPTNTLADLLKTFRDFPAGERYTDRRLARALLSPENATTVIAALAAAGHLTEETQAVPVAACCPDAGTVTVRRFVTPWEVQP